jgi:hypothetical protein
MSSDPPKDSTYGEGPLGTKLHKSATTIKYPRPTRVKNKTSAPTQASPSPPKKTKND